MADIADMIRSAERMGGSPVSRRRTEALVCVLATTGCRISEAANMRRSDLSLERDSGRVRYRTKGGQRHRAELPGWCTEALRRYFMARSVGTGHLLGVEPVFSPIQPPRTAWVHARSDSLRDQIIKLGRAAGVQGHVTPHVIRASLITRARERGESVDDVMRWSGHQDRSSVEHYDRRDVVIGEELAAEIGAALG